MWPPRQGPQVGVLKAPPASIRACMVPSAAASRQTCWVPGRMMRRTSGCTVRPRSTSAACRKSSRRPLVHEPITTWSMRTSARLAAGAVFEGRCGRATVGSTADASMSISRTYSASGSLLQFDPAVAAAAAGGAPCR